MRKKLLLIAVLGIICSSCGVESTTTSGSPSSGNETISFEGVVKYASGVALDGVSMIHADSGEAVTTDNSGNYQITNVSYSPSSQFIIESGTWSVSTSVATPQQHPQEKIDFIISEDKKSVKAILANSSPEVPVTDNPQSGPFNSAGDTSSFGIPSGNIGNVHQGKKKYFSACSSCHASIVGRGLTYGSLKRTIEGAPMNIHLPTSEVADLVAYLNFRSKG